MLKKIPHFSLALVLVALVLGGILRLFYLDRLPSAIGNDELQYILNARSFFQTGTDITGTISVLSPFIFHYPKGANPQAELPYLLLTYIVGPLPFSLLNARILGAILSTLTIPLGYLLAKKLFNHRTGIIAAFTFALNPWFIFIGRTAYEMAPAMFFYLLAFYILLTTKKWQILLSLPIFLLGFYAYIASKLIFLPFIIITCFYLIKKNKTDRRYYILLSCIALIFTVIAAYLLTHGPITRISEIITPLSPQIGAEVNSLRLTTMHTPLASLFINKLTIYFLLMVTKTLDVFSPSYLFLSGDLFFALFRQGLFYLIDSIFLVWGLLALYKKQGKEFLLLVMLALLGIVPQLLHKQQSNFTPHITMMIPFFLLMIAYGISTSVDYFKKNLGFSLRRSSFFISLAYIIGIGNFLVVYFFQFPLGGFFDFPPRILAQYVAVSERKDTKIVIVTAKKNDLIPEFMFYKNSPASVMKEAYAASQKKGPVHLKSLTFLTCGDFKDSSDTNKVYIIDSLCGFKDSSESALLIPALKDGGGIYRIYHDQTCSRYDLHTYPQNISLNLFALDHLSNQEFCTNFITSAQ